MQHFIFENWWIGEFVVSFFDVANWLQDIILTVEIEADCRIGLSKVVSSSDLVFSSILNGDIFQQ